MSSEAARRGYALREVEGDVAIAHDVAIGGDVRAEGGAHIKGDVTIEGFLDAPNIWVRNSSLRLEIFTSGDGFLAWGESMRVSCVVWRGLFADVTSDVGEWSIVRDTGNVVEDGIWNSSPKARNFRSSIDIEFNPSHNDLQGADVARFTITATINNLSAITILEI